MKRTCKQILSDYHIKMVCNCKKRHNIYCVGGTIRDFLLDIKPRDYDFAVSGSGIDFARAFARNKNGTLVLLSEQEDEARVVHDGTTYDFIGLNNRSVNEDLLRRDFTINAMAVDCKSGEWLDPSNGEKDLKKNIIRPVQKRSFFDDPLRILRGFRFALELQFKLTRTFYRYARGVTLSNIAAERIGYEMLRILADPSSYPLIRKMHDLGLFLDIFPEAKKIINDDYLWSHSLGTYEALEALLHDSFFTNIEPEFSEYFQQPKKAALLKLAGLFHDVAKPDTFMIKEGEVHFYGHDAKGARIMEHIGYERLKLSRPDVSTVTKLVKEHMRLHLLATNRELTDRAIRRFFRDLGNEWLGAMMIAWADGYATAGWTQHLERMFERMVDLKRADDAKPTIKRLITGYDLIDIGLIPGPKFKVILQELYDLQLEGKLDTKDEGLEMARAMYERL